MTQSTNNVVEFPKNKIIRDASLNEEIEKRKEKGLKNYANTLIEELTENLLMDFDNSGISVDNDAFSKDFHFLAGILTATVYRSMDLKHDLHDFIDQRVRITKVDIKNDTIEFDKLEEIDIKD